MLVSTLHQKGLGYEHCHASGNPRLGNPPSRGGEQHEFSVYWVPQRSIVCDKVLEEEGVTGDVLAEAFPLDWVPLDRDLLSLELGSAYKAGTARCCWGGKGGVE